MSRCQALGVPGALPTALPGGLGRPCVCVICPVSGGSPRIPRAGIRPLLGALPMVGPEQMRVPGEEESVWGMKSRTESLSAHCSSGEA